MKKLISLVFCLLLVTLAGCSGNSEPYEKKNYSADKEISAIIIDVRDRQVEVIPSADGKIHMDYCENSKETYDISVSQDHVLTVSSFSTKAWTDYIGGKAPAEARKITIQVPNALLNRLSISTTNEDITVAPLTVPGNVSLSANGGSILFEDLTVGSEIALDVKNGNISGAITGSYDDYAIFCTIKKGESNLPASKESGTKTLTVHANNGDVTIDIR